MAEFRDESPVGGRHELVLIQLGCHFHLQVAQLAVQQGDGDNTCQNGGKAEASTCESQKLMTRHGVFFKAKEKY
jgi:hypothetical protein